VSAWSVAQVVEKWLLIDKITRLEKSVIFGEATLINDGANNGLLKMNFSTTR